MAIFRRWWEPQAQDNRHESEGRARHSFDVGDLMSLAMNGGEFTSSQFAEVLSCAKYDRQRTTWGVSVWSGGRRVHG
jgi:hypothetical protein